MYLLNDILADAVDDKLIKPLAMYLIVKQRTNSTIYNYNPQRLSKITKLNYRTCQKYVDLLLNSGLCEMHRGNLLFKNQYRIGKGYRHKLEHGTLKHVVNQIYTILILNNKKQQKHNAGNKISTNRKVKKILTGMIEKEVFLSSRSVSKTFNCSRRKTSTILKSLKFNNVLEITERLKFIKRMPYSDFYFFIKNSNSFRYRYKKGCLYLHQGISANR